MDKRIFVSLQAGVVRNCENGAEGKVALEYYSKPFQFTGFRIESASWNTKCVSQFRLQKLNRVRGPPCAAEYLKMRLPLTNERQLFSVERFKACSLLRLPENEKSENF